MTINWMYLLFHYLTIPKIFDHAIVSSVEFEHYEYILKGLVFGIYVIFLIWLFVTRNAVQRKNPNGKLNACLAFVFKQPYVILAFIFFTVPGLTYCLAWIMYWCTLLTARG